MARQEKEAIQRVERSLVSCVEQTQPGLGDASPILIGPALTTAVAVDAQRLMLRLRHRTKIVGVET